MWKKWYIIYFRSTYMKYVKYLLVVLFLTFWTVQTSFSRFEEKLYCDITKDRIVISLDNKKFYTCKVYIRYIELQMKKVYKDILLIQKYVDKKQDLGYWNPLKSEKVVLLNLLQNMRLNIIAHTKTFENNLLETSKRYFLDSITVYKKELNELLTEFSELQTPLWKKYVSLVEQQLSVINNIAKSTTFEGLNINIERYVYLKQLIPWK